MNTVKGNITKGKTISGNLHGITEQYKKKIKDNTAARHIHQNKEILDKITEEFLKSLGSSATIVNFATNETEAEYGNRYSADGKADISVWEVIELLKNGKTVFGKRGHTLYYVSSWNEGRLESDTVIYFNGIINDAYSSEIEMRADLLDGYFVGEMRYCLSNVSTSDGSNVMYKEGDIIIDAPSDSYAYKVYRANNDFRSDNAFPNIKENCECLSADHSQSASHASTSEYAESASYAGRADTTSFAERNMDGYTIIPQLIYKKNILALPYIFEHNTITFAINSELENIAFLFNDGEYPSYYSSELYFETRTVAPMLVYPEAPIINWVGTDCTLSEDNYSIFAPQPHTHYDILFYFNGVNITGLVNGYKLASGNS